MYNVYDRGNRRLFIDHNTGSVGTSVLVSGGVGKVGSSFTISTTASQAVIVLPNNFLSDGTSDKVLIQGVFGTLARAGSAYTFQAATAPFSAVSVPVNATIYPYQVDKSTNPFPIGDAVLSEALGLLSISTPIEVANGFKLVPVPTTSGFINVLVEETTGQIYFGIKKNGGLVFTRVDSDFALKDFADVLVNQENGQYLIDIRDKNDVVMAALKRNGSALIESLLIGDVELFRNQDPRYFLNIFDEIMRRICFGIRKTGIVEIDTLAVRKTLSTASSSALHYVGSNGQSNSVGADAYDFIDVVQPYNNTKLLDTAGTYTTIGDNLVFAPLTAPIRPLNGGGAYPDNIGGQDPSTALANTMSWLLGGGNRWHMAVYGQGGTGIDVWGKGGSGNSWVKGDFEFQAAVAIAKRQDLEVLYEAEFLVAGENDYNSTTYLAKLIQFGFDVQGRKKLNGQPNDIPVLSYQQHTFATDGTTTSLSTMAELYAGLQSPHHNLIGPRYQKRYEAVGVNGASGVHHNAWAYLELGEKAAQVLDHIKNKGSKWKPLRPIKIAHNTTTGIIQIDLSAPVGQLRFDRHLPRPQYWGSGTTPHYWSRGRGFTINGITLDGSYLGNNNPVTFSGNSILIQVPPGVTPSDGLLHYATKSANQTGTYVWGDRNNQGARNGEVCDSDPFRAYLQQKLICSVTNGSAVVTIGARGFRRVGWYWRVECEQRASGLGNAAPLLPFDCIVKTRDSDTQVTLSDVWPGATGSAELTFRPDHSNYLVAFSLPTNYQE
jgi:hypothetical protein